MSLKVQSQMPNFVGSSALNYIWAVLLEGLLCFPKPLAGFWAKSGELAGKSKKGRRGGKE